MFQFIRRSNTVRRRPISVSFAVEELDGRLLLSGTSTGDPPPADTGGDSTPEQEPPPGDDSTGDGDLSDVPTDDMDPDPNIDADTPNDVPTDDMDP